MPLRVSKTPQSQLGRVRSVAYGVWSARRVCGVDDWVGSDCRFSDGAEIWRRDFRMELNPSNSKDDGQRNLWDPGAAEI